MKPMNCVIRCLLAAACASFLSTAGAAVITTVAGSDSSGDGGLAVNAPVAPTAVALDSAGNLFFVNQNRIRKITTGGTILAVAGGAVAGYAGDGGPATSAQLNGPVGIVLDAAGNLYIADRQNHRIRKVDTSGIITTVAGNGTAGFSGDGGPAAAAMVNLPNAVAIDDSGALLIADTNNHRVRRVVGGNIATVAGTGVFATSGEGGPAVAAQIQGPQALVADGAGGYYIGTFDVIHRVGADGVITRFAGTGTAMTPLGDGGPAVQANFSALTALARDSAGNVYAAFIMAQAVRMIAPSGIVTRIAGTGLPGYSGDGGPALQAQFFTILGLASSPGGVLYVGDSTNARIRKIDAARIVTSIAGVSTDAYGDGGPATSAGLGDIVNAGIGAGPAGSFYVAGGQTFVIRRVDSAGLISTLPPRTNIRDVAVDAAGNYYVLSLNSVVRYSPGGMATHVAGITAGGFSGDGGPAIQAKLNNPASIALDSAGNLYIADSDNARVRRVDAGGVITTIAGNAMGVDTGTTALQKAISPRAVTVDGSGNVYVGEYYNQRVVKVSPSGAFAVVAGVGSGNPGTDADGIPATSARIGLVGGVAVDASGNVYFSEIIPPRIRMVGLDGLISTIAGNGTKGYSGDGGEATLAQLNEPTDLAIDSNGHLLILDTQNQKVRKVSIADTLPAAFTFPTKSGVALNALVESDPLTPTDFAAAATVRVAAGEYSIGCTGTYVSTQGSINPGQSVCVRHAASSLNNKDTVTTLTIGGRPGTFTSLTVPGAGSIAVAPSPLAFGIQSMNTTSPAQAVTVTNSGATTITIHSVFGTAGFGATHDCATLAAGATCMVLARFTPGAQGLVNGSITVRASSGDQLTATSGTGERSLISHYYQAILGRAPEAGGRAFWEGEAARFAGLGANSNETVFAMAAQFFNSPEYVALNRDNAGFLADLYTTFFNRAPDASGNSFWLGQMGSGLPREVVMVSFMFSPEFGAFTEAIFGTPTSRPEVDMVMDFYRGLLARLPDTAGFNSWLARFRTAQCTGASAVRNEVNAITSEFIASPEYQGRGRTNGQFVGDMYNAILRRGGDPMSVQQWINLLNNGTYTRDVVRGGFTQSSEFQQRVNRVIAAGCQP